MRKLIMIASAAAMAVSMPALAEKGGKGGGGGGNGGGKSAQAHGGGHGNHGGGGAKVRGGGNGGGGQAHHAAHGGGGGGKPDKAQRQASRGGGKPDKAQRQADRGPVRQARADRAPKTERRNQQAQEQRTVRIDTRDDFRRAEGSGYDNRDYRDGTRFISYGANQSCPPGLAKKGNGCLPPGQARKVYAMGQRIEQPWYGGYNIPSQYSAFYRDNDAYSYRYDDNGYIYRLDNGSNMISGLIPLLGGGFAVGQPLPAGYDVYNVPYQYRDDYYDNGDDMYRYGDNAIYRADADSGMIESIVALLAGDMNVGQQLPEGYDAYNVPMEYRDEYADTDEYDYRYADGNIYQVDTKTQIIQAIVEMIA
jgi:hypothetical protein